jgi:imidazolonepropionase-like amidohydrolase/Tol biopolymer transport system component
MRTRPIPLVVFFALALGAAGSADQAAQGPSADTAKPPESLVLPTAETLEFTTDEVTWPSVDVSPDGRTLAFDVLGDIYTIPIDGGTATRIIGGLSFESQPRYSPDGKTLAFLTDRSGVENLWIADADGGNPRAVSKDGLTRDRPQLMVSPSWTPDGQYIVVSKSRPPDPGTLWLFMYHRDGGSGVRVGAPPPPQPSPDQQGPPPTPPTNRMGAVVSPDGRYIYYAQRTGTFTYNARFPLWQIYRHDRETGDVTQVTNAQGSAMRPVLSPDGKLLVYGTRYKTETGLRVRTLESGAERWLVYPVTRDDQESRASRDTLPGYAFMPDGQSLVVPIGGKLHRVDVATGQSRVIPMTVPVRAEIAPRVYTPVRIDDGDRVRARLVRWPSVSPDGKRAVFSAMNRLYVVDLPNGTPRLLTSPPAAPAAPVAPGTPGTSGTSGTLEGEFMPSWSPDGQSIVYTTWSTTGGHIRRVPSSGGPPQTLTAFEGYYLDPVFTPDGARVVYLAGAVSDQLYSILLDTPPADEQEEHGAPGEIGGISPPNTLEIRWMPSAGGASTLVASAQGGRRPHFARDDSARIYLSGARGLQSIDISGYDRRTLMRVTGSGVGNNPPGADEISVSPDGTRAFVNLQGKHFIVPVPRAGRETVELRIQGRGDPTSVPITRLSPEGGDYVGWTADSASVTWAQGALFFRQSASGGGQLERMDFVVERPRARPQGSLLLTGARVITMRGDEVIARGDVLVTNNRIAGVGARGSLKPPAGTRTIDVSGRTIMPGLVDAHSHMWAPRGVHLTEVWQYMSNLAYGVTTTRDPQTSTPDVFAYADMVDAGVIPGPRIFATGPGIFSTSGIEDRDSASRYMKRYKEAYHTNTIKQYVAGDRLVRQWLIQAAQEYGITATIEGSLDLKLNLTQMADGYSGQEHSFPILPLYKDVVEFVARTKTFYTPTILVAYGAPWSENYWFESENAATDPKLHRWVPEELLDTMVRRRPQWFLPEEYGHTRIGKQVADIVHAGGKASLGSHGQLQGLGAHWETWNLASGGLTPHETLRVVTIYGAENIGLQQDVGSLEVGKMADLVVLDRNPLENIKNTNSVRYVMKNGELYEGDTLNMIWPEAKTMKKPFWEGFGPKK